MTSGSTCSTRSGSRSWDGSPASTAGGPSSPATSPRTSRRRTAASRSSCAGSTRTRWPRAPPPSLSLLSPSAPSHSRSICGSSVRSSGRPATAAPIRGSASPARSTGQGSSSSGREASASRASTSLGLAYQYRRNSHFIGGVGRDAELVARSILARSGARSHGAAGLTAERLLAPFPSGPRTAIVNAP